MAKYLIIIEKAGKNFSAYSPDVSGVYASAKTEKETRRLMRQALKDHLKWLRESGDPIPKPSATPFRVAV